MENYVVAGKLSLKNDDGPLAGLRVIDHTSVVVGPVSTRILADYGADVIKVESPSGDLLRSMADGGRNAKMSPKFMNFNSNKKSICLNLKSPKGRKILIKLLKDADIYVSNVRPASLKKLGLDYRSIKKINPMLIYCSIVGFGSKGRYSNRPAYDPIIQSLSGIAATNERATKKPRFVPMVMTDHITGLIASQAIGFALYRREKKNIGEFIEVPMFENMAAFTMAEHMGGELFDPPTGPTGDLRQLTDSYRPFETSDGYMTVTPNTDEQTIAFFKAIGREDLINDERFQNAYTRTVHNEEYAKIREKELKKKSSEDWLKIFQEADVPCARYNSLEDLFQDPHLNDVNFFKIQDHPSEGKIKTFKPANKFSGGNNISYKHAPKLGENTLEILERLGIPSDEINNLIESKIAFSS